MKTKVYAPKKLNPTAQRMLADRSVSVIVDNFHGVDWHKKTKTFPVFTVFFSPADFPGKYAVRLFDGDKPTRLLAVKDTLEQARKTIPTEQFCCVPRSEKDNPAVVETWL